MRGNRADPHSEIQYGLDHKLGHELPRMYVSAPKNPQEDGKVHRSRDAELEMGFPKDGK
jgi:hypothetical protein